MPLERVGESLLSLVDSSCELNSKLFSLPRFKLLAVLASFKEVATFSDLKNSLKLSDGALHANLKALIEMGYVKSVPVELGKKKLEAYCITGSGLIEWNHVKAWLKKFLEAV